MCLTPCHTQQNLTVLYSEFQFCWISYLIIVNITSFTVQQNKFTFNFYLTYQSTVDDVDGLYRRHEDFEKKLKAQDDKVKALNELADKLVAEGHPDSDKQVFFFFF